ncbi:MAG: hypothetical protein M9963_10915 [Kiritimatiellae bacterium]|nr:hypothetical protein [Kiritimatiellia bacterium]
MKRATSIACALLAISLAAGCGRSRAHFSPNPDEALTAVLSTNTVQIGQPFTFTSAIKAGPTDRVDWPMPGQPPAIVVRNSRELSDGIPPGFRARQWELLALRPGTFPIWTSAVARAQSGGAPDRIAPPQIEVHVIPSLQPGDEAIRDIVGLQQWPHRIATRLLLLLGVVVLLSLLVALLVRALRRKRNKPAPAEVALPPHEVALRALRALRAKGWPDSHGIEAFYVELTQIVRRFLEGAFFLRAPEQTTEEFIRAAATARGLQAEHKQLVFAFLEQSDLVKFAKHEPAQSDMEAALAAAERLVTETQPPPTDPSTPPPLRKV